jgi:SAM-dependent methyltransferase
VNLDLAPDSSRVCRCCGAKLTETFADLGVSPLANSFVPPQHAHRMEPFYPLRAYVCESCWLVQLTEYESPQRIFSDYIYFSSFSDSWLRHAETYAERMISRFDLGAHSLAVEVASNDGYLLQYFLKAGIRVLGIDPAANVAEYAVKKSIPTEIAFFNRATAERLRDRCTPDLMTANNVLAHVPNIHDFVEGFRVLLAPSGVATFEFPHLLRLIAERQFDTIYHEHFSYLSLLVVERIFAEHGLVVFDIDQLPTHGGSLRLYARHAANTFLQATEAVEDVRQAERRAGLQKIDIYRQFSQRVIDTKCQLLEFLIGARRAGKRVVGYGAPAKGNTLLNYCGVGPELVTFTVDRSPHKQGLLLPGSRIPVRVPSSILETRPDYVLVLPWNLREEISGQMAEVRDWGGRFVVAIPELTIF